MNRLLVNLIAFFGGFLAVCFVAKAMGAEPTTNMMDAQTSPPPIAVHAVTQCGEVVVMWVLKVDRDGQARFYRTDAMHHPDTGEEYNAFLQWAARAPKDQTDVLDLPCLNKGKAK